MNRDRVYVEYALECMAKIRRYTAGGRDDFLRSDIVLDAVLRNLHTLAESTQRLSSGLKDAHPEIVWSDIAAFRNVIVHDYLGVDPVEVWTIVENDLPPLEKQLSALLPSVPAGA